MLYYRPLKCATIIPGEFVFLSCVMKYVSVLHNQSKDIARMGQTGYSIFKLVGQGHCLVLFRFLFALTKGAFEVANQELDSFQRVYFKNIPPLVDKERIHLQLPRGEVIASLRYDLFPEIPMLMSMPKLD